MRHRLRRLRDARPAAASGLVRVLVASLAVAGVLAYQAISAARQRRAVSEAMLVEQRIVRDSIDSVQFE